MVHFSAAQVALLAVLAILAVGIPTWVLYALGSRIPPALRCEGRKSGFGGSLLVLEAVLVSFFLSWVLFTSGDLAQASRFMSYRLDVPAWQILTPLIPDVLFVFLFGWVAVRLAFVRKARMPAEAIAIIWALGPIAGVLSSMLYKTGFDWTGLAVSVVLAAAATLYLALSERVQLTYGTARGRALKPRVPVSDGEKK